MQTSGSEQVPWFEMQHKQCRSSLCVLMKPAKQLNVFWISLSGLILLTVMNEQTEFTVLLQTQISVDVQISHLRCHCVHYTLSITE